MLGEVKMEVGTKYLAWLQQSLITKGPLSCFLLVYKEFDIREQAIYAVFFINWSQLH